jgi:hypothetical protein
MSEVIDMDRIDAPLELRYGDAEYYVAIARGFKDVAEFRAFRAARETRNYPKPASTTSDVDIRSYRLRMMLLAERL